MSESLEFDEVYYYDNMQVGIALPVIIRRGDESEELSAKVDTGASFCIFRRFHGIALGLDVESGIPVSIGTATGSFRAFGHDVSLEFLGIETQSTVYFAESDQFDRNVLGRSGWLNRVKLGLIESEGKLLISAHS